MTDWRITNADVLDGLRQIGDGVVQTVVTSPPYYGLRDYGVDGQLGLEATPDCLGWATGDPCGECYICHMLAVFAELWRVLRDDGTVWLNIGDSYARNGSDRAAGLSSTVSSVMRHRNTSIPVGLKAKDLMMIPARLVLALQSSGWYIRSDICWAKKNGMPESVQDRPSKAWEHIFLLTKSQHYYYDNEAVREAAIMVGDTRHLRKDSTKDNANPDNGSREKTGNPQRESRNLRDFWLLATEPFKEAHFATFPTAIPERCIEAGTSEKGQCSKCGKPWRRKVSKTFIRQDDVSAGKGIRGSGDQKPMDSSNGLGGFPRGRNITSTTGWAPQCKCGADVIPQLVLDPFCGAATTGLVAVRLRRAFRGIELSPVYVAMGEKRILEDHGADPEQVNDFDDQVQLRMFD